VTEAEPISVICEADDPGWTCSVTVGSGAGMTRHHISVSMPELDRFAPGEYDPTSLVERSLRFLLDREAKESILRSFAISEIERYFPEYPDTVRPPRQSSSDSRQL